MRCRQTKSGKYPYLYSQAQAVSSDSALQTRLTNAPTNLILQIHARSLLPCQDTPAIKATYSSKVRSILPVLMSGLRISPPSEDTPNPGKEAEYVYDQVSLIVVHLRRDTG